MARIWRRLSRTLVFLLALIGALQLTISFTPILPGWIHLLTGEWQEPKGDVLILLGAGSVEHGLIGISSYWRVTHAANSLETGGFKQVIISGDLPASHPMQEILTYRGYPRDRILLESRSNSTRDNALFTAALPGRLPGRQILMSSDFHMYRATRAFRKAGIPVVPSPAPDAGKRVADWRQRWPIFWDLALETVKIGYYQWNGWI